MPVMDKQIPEPKALNKEQPEPKALDKEQPEPKELNKEQPEGTKLDKPMPPAVNPENVIKIGDEEFEIKPTKLKYQRNRTAAAYRVLDVYPLPDVLAMEKGVLDPDRDGDEVVYDFLTAVFDNSDIVRRLYDEMDSETIDRAVKIFKRLNHISEKEEQAKNREAKGTRK